MTKEQAETIHAFICLARGPLYEARYRVKDLNPEWYEAVELAMDAVSRATFFFYDDAWEEEPCLATA